jgi:hypothetical protein
MNACASAQGLLAGARRDLVLCVQAGGQRGGEQVDDGRAQPGAVGRAVVVQVGDDLADERGEEGAGAAAAGDADAAEPGDLLVGQRQQRPREHQGDGPLAGGGSAGGDGTSRPR